MGKIYISEEIKKLGAEAEKDTKHALLKDFNSPFSIDMNLYPEFE